MAKTLHLKRHVDTRSIVAAPADNGPAIKRKTPRIPKPAPGMVIHYSYLWNREAVEGKQEGLKDRPCVVIGVLPPKQEGAKPDVLVAAITHSEPMNVAENARFIEIPTEEKKRLGMDDLPSYVCCSEVNRFEWPGSDLRLISSKNSYTYGLMDKAVFGQVRERVLDIKGAMVRRDLDEAFVPENAA